MFERFTDQSKQVVTQAQSEARDLDHSYVGTEHLLLGLLGVDDSIAYKALSSHGIVLDRACALVEEIVGRGRQAPGDHLPFTPRCKRVLELSLRDALQLGHNYIAPEHLLLVLIREGNGTGTKVMVELGADLNKVRRETIELLGQKSSLTPQEAAAQQRTRAEILAELDAHAAAITRLAAELNQLLDT